MIKLQIILIFILLFILIKTKPIIIWFSGIVASLYPIFFNISYINDFIPDGISYVYYMSDKDIYITNISYIVLLVALLVVPAKKRINILDTEFKIKNKKIIFLLMTVTFFMANYNYFFNINTIINLAPHARREFFNSLDTIHIAKIFFDMTFVYIVYSDKCKIKSKLFKYSLILFTLSSLLQIYAGNRRELLLIILYISPRVYNYIKKCKIRSKFSISIIIIMCVIMMIILPITRMGGEVTSLERVSRVFFGYSDFNAPYQTLAYEMHTRDELQLMKSYSKSINILLENIFKFKLDTIYTMEEFMYNISKFKYEGNEIVGWTYTPITESYISFGYVGIFLIYPISMVMIFTFIIKNIRFTNERLGLFLMMFYQYFRGDLANIVSLFTLYFIARCLIIAIGSVDKNFNVPIVKNKKLKYFI